MCLEINIIRGEMKMRIFIATAILFFASCSSKLDLNKAGEFKTVEKWDGSIFRATIPAHYFASDTLSNMTVKDTIPFELFDKNWIKKGFVRIDLETYGINTIPSSFDLSIEYSDGSHTLAATELAIPPGEEENPSSTVMYQSIDTAVTPPFTMLRYLVVRLTKNDTAVIRNQGGNLTVGVNFRLYLQIE